MHSVLTYQLYYSDSFPNTKKNKKGNIIHHIYSFLMIFYIQLYYFFFQVDCNFIDINCFNMTGLKKKLFSSLDVVTEEKDIFF